ncbi:MAG: hypothetical protein LBT57_03005 [Puniceicoccales bacterium]|jgi:hypothetical protein|nr:hypothetical protein [Puniceicoccales bacterium]
MAITAAYNTYIPDSIPGASPSRAQTLASPSSTGLDAASFVGVSQTLMVDGKLDVDAVDFLIQDSNSTISTSLQRSDLSPERRASLLKELNAQYGNAGEAMTLSSLEDTLTALMIFQIQSAQDRKRIERQANAELRSQIYKAGMESADKIVEKGRLEANSTIAQAAIQFGTTVMATGASLLLSHKADTKKTKEMGEIDNLEKMSQPDVSAIDTGKEAGSLKKFSPEEITQMRRGAENQFQKDMQMGDALSKLIMTTGNFAATVVGAEAKKALAEMEGDLQRGQAVNELRHSLQQSIQGGIEDAAKAQETAMRLLEQMLNNLHQGATAIRMT